MRKLIVLIGVIMLMLLTGMTICAEDIPTAKVTAMLVGDEIPAEGEKFVIEINMEEISSNLFVSGEIDFHYPVDVVTPVRYTKEEPTPVTRGGQMIGGVTNRFSTTEYTGKFSTISKIDLSTGSGAIAVYIDINAEDQSAEVLSDGNFTMFGLAFMLNEGYTYDDFYFSIDSAAAFLTANKQIVSRYKEGKIQTVGIGETEIIVENGLAESSGYLLTMLAQASDTDAYLNVNVNLLYNGEYNESVLIKNKQFAADISIINLSSEDTDVVCYVAEYNEDNSLLGFIKSSVITVSSGSATTERLEYNFINEDSIKAKVFVWNDGTLMPTNKGVVLTAEATDYYADTYTEANNIELNKQICGEINIESDVDIVKISTVEAGNYVVKFSADDADSYVLSDTENNVINAVAVDGNCKMYNLSGDSVYYLKMTGNADDNYHIKPMSPEIVVKNIGSNGSLNDLYDCELFEFVPETKGEYIITAVGTEGAKASLYNSDFEKISSSDIGDDYVSFRITYDMTADEKYYIVVEQKENTTEATIYELYVEEPFEIVSVQ